MPPAFVLFRCKTTAPTAILRETGALDEPTWRAATTIR